MLMETGKESAPDDVVAPLLHRLESWYRLALSNRAEVIKRWTALSSYSNGCPVSVETSSGIWEGVTRGVADTGALIVEDKNGLRREIVSGEVRLRKAVVSG
jgi:biotin-(acetyl-CoA carboxylase) ligase